MSPRLYRRGGHSEFWRSVVISRQNSEELTALAFVAIVRFVPAASAVRFVLRIAYGSSDKKASSLAGATLQFKRLFSTIIIRYSCFIYHL